MTEKETARTALEQSIEKWRRIECEDGEDCGADNCALCDVYIENCCIGCPVYEHTGIDVCSETPYEVWDKLLEKYMQDNGIVGFPYDKLRIAWTDELADLARQEREFLESLRPLADKLDGNCEPTGKP